MSNRVVITGINCLVAAGDNINRFWSALLNNETGLKSISFFDVQNSPCKIAGEIPHITCDDYSNRYICLGLKGFEDFYNSLDYSFQNKPIGTYFGVATNDLDFTTGNFFNLKPHLKKTAFLDGMPGSLGANIVRKYEFNTTPLTFSDACSSGIEAIGWAYQQIKHGVHDIAIVGSSEAGVVKWTYDSFLNGNMISLNQDPKHAVKPFDKNVSKSVLAEGSAFVLLESLDHAKKRFAKIYCEIIGHGSGVDKHKLCSPNGFINSISEALKKSQIDIINISAINCHAPGDRNLDIKECTQLHNIFGEKLVNIPLVSIKGSIGSPFATAGVTQVITAAKCLEKQILHPTPCFEELHPILQQFKIQVVSQYPIERKLEYIIVNSRGATGCHDAIILKRI